MIPSRSYVCVPFHTRALFDELAPCHPSNYPGASHHVIEPAPASYRTLRSDSVAKQP